MMPVVATRCGALRSVAALSPNFEIGSQRLIPSGLGVASFNMSMDICIFFLL
jgi:hypothetical protein